MVKNLSSVQETWVPSLGQDDPLEKGVATHSSILAWGIPWTEEPSGLPSNGSQTVRHNLATNSFTFIRILGGICQEWWTKIIYIFLLISHSESESHSVVSDSLQPYGLYSPWHSLGQNTGVGSLSLLQAIFLTQGLNLGLLHCGWILYQLSCKESA